MQPREKNPINEKGEELTVMISCLLSSHAIRQWAFVDLSSCRLLGNLTIDLYSVFLLPNWSHLTDVWCWHFKKYNKNDCIVITWSQRLSWFVLQHNVSEKKSDFIFIFEGKFFFFFFLAFLMMQIYLLHLKLFVCAKLF